MERNDPGSVRSASSRILLCCAMSASVGERGAMWMDTGTEKVVIADWVVFGGTLWALMKI